MCGNRERGSPVGIAITGLQATLSKPGDDRTSFERALWNYTWAGLTAFTRVRCDRARSSVNRYGEAVFSGENLGNRWWRFWTISWTLLEARSRWMFEREKDRRETRVYGTRGEQRPAERSRIAARRNRNADGKPKEPWMGIIQASRWMKRVSFKFWPRFMLSALLLCRCDTVFCKLLTFWSEIALVGILQALLCSNCFRILVGGVLILN